VLLYLLGLVMLAAGVVALLEARLGAGPVDVLLSGGASRTGLAHGTAGLILSGVLLTVALATRCQVQLGTVAGSALLGPLINLILASGVIAPGESLVVRSAVFALGQLAIAFGVAFVINAGLGTGTLELLAERLAGRLPTSVPATRTAIDMLFVLTGAAIGGQVGAGTVIFALTFGYLLEAASRMTERARGAEVEPQLRGRLRRRTSRRV
jgi:uncharacterized membrane protein YczE